MLTVPAGVNVPKAQIDRIREVIPETRYMSPGRILRYSLARTIGYSHDEAMRACQDARSAIARQVLDNPPTR